MDKAIVEGSLKKKTAKSFFWVAIDVFGQRILQFVIGIILARLLAPEEFGLIGLITVFITFSVVFIDSGFSFALIRKKEVEAIEYTTIFWFNLTVSIICYTILFLTSKYIADFYNQEILNNLVKVIGLILIINAVGSIQYVKLRKELKFKELAIIGFFSKFISGGVALAMAYSDFGVWSLVAQQVLVNVVKVMLMFWYSWFWPRLKFSIHHFKELFSIGSKLLYGSIVNAIVSNIYPIIIGKYFSVKDVGYFTRAKGLNDLPVLLLTGIVQQVTLPTFSLIQDENTRFVNSYRTAIKVTLYIVLLPLVVLFISAFPLIDFLLTSKWLPAAPMLQIITIGSIFYPVSALNVNIIGIKGRTDLVMIMQFLKDGFTILGVIIGMFFGIFGLVWAFAITSNISFLINIFFTSRVVDYSLKKQIVDILPIFSLATITAIISYFITYKVELPNLIMVITQVFVVCSIYLGLSWFFKLSELKSSIELIKKMIK